MKQSFFLLLSVVLFVSCQRAEEKAAASDLSATTELREKIQDYFSALNELGKFNGVVYASKDGMDIIHQAYNLHPEKSSTTYVSPESQFDIHSVSKLMARYLIEKYELERKLSKRQFIHAFFPDFPNGEKITIEMLLHHTSGLPRELEGVEGDAIDLTSEQILAHAKKQALLFEPGTDKQYSNVGYEIVYFIIQQISEKSFAQCLSDDLFKPLDMQHSGAHFYTRDNKRKNLAKNHEKGDSTILQVDNVSSDELKTARIFSTATDLNKFLNHLRQEPYASLLKDESDVIEKSGGSDGIRVEVYTHLKHNYNFIFLANYEEVPFQQTVEDFANILEGKAYDIPKALNRTAIVLPSAALQKYVGTYSFADLGKLELTFEVEGTNLVVWQEGEQIASLRAESETVFFDDPKEPASFEFIDNEKGEFDVLMGFKGVKLKGVKQ